MRWEVTCRLNDRPVTALTVVENSEDQNKKFFEGLADGRFRTIVHDQDNLDWCLRTLEKIGATEISYRRTDQ